MTMVMRYTWGISMVVLLVCSEQPGLAGNTVSGASPSPPVSGASPSPPRPKRMRGRASTVAGCQDAYHQAGNNTKQKPKTRVKRGQLTPEKAKESGEVKKENSRRQKGAIPSEAEHVCLGFCSIWVIRAEVHPCCSEHHHVIENNEVLREVIYLGSLKYHYHDRKLVCSEVIYSSVYYAQSF